MVVHQTIVARRRPNHSKIFLQKRPCRGRCTFVLQVAARRRKTGRNSRGLAAAGPALAAPGTWRGIANTFQEDGIGVLVAELLKLGRHDFAGSAPTEAGTSLLLLLSHPYYFHYYFYYDYSITITMTITTIAIAITVTIIMLYLSLSLLLSLLR